MNTTAHPITFTAALQRVVQTIARRLHAVFDIVRRARQRSKMLHELQRLDDHVLRDIGVHRTELLSVVAELAGAAPATRHRVPASKESRP